MRLHELVKEAADLSENVLDLPLEPDVFLPDVLDSIGLTTLLALIEEEWGVLFEDDELLEILESPSSLAAAVSKKMG